MSCRATFNPPDMACCVLPLPDKQKMNDELRAICGNEAAAAATAALAAVYDAVSIYSEPMQCYLLPDYYGGYKNWLLAGLPPLADGEALRQIGNNAPNVWNAFMLEIDATRPPLGDEMRRLLK